ncbi:hypothetical protein D0T87_16860 [Bacteroides sp. 51]|nr:hypothetical protein [Bacteroides sp. 51]
MIEIKNKQNETFFSTPINTGCLRKKTLMTEDYILLKFKVANPIQFERGDYAIVDGIRYEVVDLSHPTYNTSTMGYDYELRLDAYYWKWKNKKFKFTPENGGQEASWSLTDTLSNQMSVFLRNLEALKYKYNGDAFKVIIDEDKVDHNKALFMTYDNINLLDALFSLGAEDKWNCDIWIKDNEIHFGRCDSDEDPENPVPPVDFEVGVNVEGMSQSNSKSTFATRIYAFGSTKNIPANYRPVDENRVVNGIVQKRLMLPADPSDPDRLYIDAYEGMSQEEAVEDVVVFEDVYPRRVGTIEEVIPKVETEKIENPDGTTYEDKWNAYWFVDPGITFSKEYVLPEKSGLKIKFESESLNGMEFELQFNPENAPEKNDDGTWNAKAQIWKIIRNEDYGRPLPDDVLKPKAGDKYILSGFDATTDVFDYMVSEAEKELKQKAKEYVAKTKIDPSTYTCKMLTNEDSELLKIGDKVNLINPAYFETGSRQSRIIGFEYNLDIPYDHPVYTVGETTAYSRIGDIEARLNTITYKGQAYAGSSGSSGSSVSTNKSDKLKKDILVNSNDVGYIKKGDVVASGDTWEQILRNMLYRPVGAELRSTISTSNDVEHGSPKGYITYMATRNGQGAMTEAYFDDNKKNELIFSAESFGTQEAVRQLYGNYTERETYKATVEYAASTDGQLDAKRLTNTISVNVYRKWFAGVVDSKPKKSNDVWALSTSGLYKGGGTYKFEASNWKMIAICFPEGDITSLEFAEYSGNLIKDKELISDPEVISVTDCNGESESAINYKMWIMKTSIVNDTTNHATLKIS